MDKIKDLISKIIILCYKKYRNYWNRIKLRSLNFGKRERNSLIVFPAIFANPSSVFIHDFVRIDRNSLIYNYTGKFVMKEYSVASANLMVVTGNHVPTVGIPMSLLAPLHINDKETDVIVEEDVWIGANVTLIAGTYIGRGAVIGANTLVNKPIPPYAIAVGSPAKIIGVKFSLEQILKHEKVLYSEDKRFTRTYLEELFAKYYQNNKNIGIDNMTDEELVNIYRDNNYPHYN